MKADEIKINSLVWSESQKSFGQVIRKKSFMCLVMFASSSKSLWLHPVDLSRTSPDRVLGME